ncbi:ABC transporter permease [Shimazuella alba]|uniref:ABC transporter permease subunit n=1 Tax=Shimazuella alba TaxID=2690964 RepID=A0A6I4VPK8_9BACL|nr:ABC transporter permease [Shimazuella alba]MXQ53567.1 ABC transporter permease subunit [Shimazuella alba]
MTWYIFQKELKDSLRDSKTILLSVLLPIVFITGMLFFTEKMMSDTDEQIKVAVANSTDKEILSWLKEIKGLELIPSANPLKMVVDGKANVAFSADADFSLQLKDKKIPKVLFQADPTSTKGGNAQEKIANAFTLKKDKLVQSRLLENNIDPKEINPFQINMKSISKGDDQSLYIISIIAQLIIVLAVLMGGIPAANDLFAGEKERKTMETLLMTPVHRIHLIVGKWLTIAVLSMISGVFSVISFILGVNLFTEKLAIALKLDQNVSFFTISLLVGIIFFALLVSSVQIIISLFANNLKEAQNYITPITTGAMIPYFLLIGVSVNELTTTHFLIPFLNIYALIKQLIYGIYDINSILLVSGSSVVFIALSFFIAYTMFMKSKWVLGKN